MAKRDFYDILGLHRGATAEEIKKAYRRLAMKHHPDRAAGDKKAAEAKFNEIQEAYDVLSDPAKRRNYDQFGHAGVGAGPSGAGGPPGGDPFEALRRAQGGGRRQWRANPNVSAEDFDFGAGGGDVASVFEQFFGRGGMGGRGGRARGPDRAAPRRGADVEHPVTISFEQAARGTSLSLRMTTEGKPETIEVKIPPGVKDGSRIRIRGRGQQSAAGAPGDLFIIARVTPHPYFRREGLDVYLDVPVSIYEAVLGTKVDVPTLEGPLTVTIPPGTSSGAKLRLKGRGVERADEKGDQFVVVKVVVPKDLDEAGKNAFRDLAAKNPIDARRDLGW